MCVITPNFVAISQPVAEIWRFSDFQNGGNPPSWITKYSTFNDRYDAEGQI